MCIAHRLLLSTSEIFDATASMPSLGYFALQHRVAPPRKAYSLTSSAFLAFGALYPFSFFKPVFRGSHKHDVMFCAELTTEQSHHYSARWCAVIRFKSIKVVWGKTRVFPHMRHITSVELSSQTVQWTVWEKALECLTCCWQRKLLYFSDTLRLSPRHTLCSHSHILYCRNNIPAAGNGKNCKEMFR